VSLPKPPVIVPETGARNRYGLLLLPDSLPWGLRGRVWCFASR